MSGTLYVVGVGPGDPELLTLKAVRILREVPVICVPKGKEEGSSLALSVVEKAIPLEGKEIIEAHFPMRKTRGVELPCEVGAKWHQTVETILSRTSRGTDLAFITIGDPTIYSTFFYLYDKLVELNPELKVEIVPGVSSITAAAARARVSLGLADEKIAVLPATYVSYIKETLETFDTVICMKVYRVFDKIMRTLVELNLTDNAIYVSRAGMEDEKIVSNVREVTEEDLNYFSMVIIRR
ncbi:MAG: precorrin-2 C(20)-methyltransferase [Chloroflexota bacterium]